MSQLILGLVFLADVLFAAPQKAVIIPVFEMIDFGLSAFIKRSIDSAKTYQPDIVVFEIDTYGGRVDAAFEITDNISAIDWAKTVAFVKTKAISAGALISLACNELVMVEGTTIGDCAPITMDQEGPKEMGEKFQSPLRAKFRALAKKNGYPEKLAEAMVSKDMEIIEIVTPQGRQVITSREFEVMNPQEKAKIKEKKILVEKGRLLTIDAHEALNLGFSKWTVKNFDEFLEKYEIPKQNVLRHFKTSWSERFVRLIDKFAPILLMVGLAALYFEFKTPGFGIPGIVGIICLTLVFSSKFMVGLANYTELLLFVIGVGLIITEIFILPGFGITGAAGLLLMFMSLVLSFQNFTIPRFPWEFKILYKNLLLLGGVFIGSLILFITTALAGGQALARTRIFHQSSENLSEGFRSSANYSGLLQKTGLTVTDLHPAGYAEIEGQRINVVSDGGFISKGTAVRVNEVIGNRIVVETFSDLKMEG